ncbi:hypothetical protein HW511_14205 [Asaia siamensis]|uniref:Uncharacterized protein n=1 Tax=Asaia siamensis TaxID=110479 RepID=A0ABQ1MGZ6_9PROT|nr:hypothetical protein [Asaia siamensis]GBR07021.1 hypothetical protein AA0323_1641 [Asaia siamensis NRIC 0323]GGC40553.1 hypothetical protein GCM10007207_27490 [Asaia siamensis]
MDLISIDYMTQTAFALFCLTCTLGLPGTAKAGNGTHPAFMPARTETVPMAITSDTLDYCKTLARKVHRTLRQSVTTPAPVVNKVMYLEHEGEALCAHGHLRSGIAQERRALVVLIRS